MHINCLKNKKLKICLVNIKTESNKQLIGKMQSWIIISVK